MTAAWAGIAKAIPSNPPPLQNERPRVSQFDYLPSFGPGRPAGGTELQAAMVRHALPELCDQVQIICSRPEQVALEDKPRILWLHDLPNDPASRCLFDPSYRTKFNAIVFVSYWQQAQYAQVAGIPYKDGVVIKNGIPECVPTLPKPRGEKLKFIYTPTPHRGLTLLAAAADVLATVRQDWELHVYSSLKVYGRDEQDAQFAPLYDRLQQNPCVVYHGSRPYEEVRAAVNDAHVFVYPSIYPETFSKATVEALSSGCLTITSSLGALPEVCGEWAWMLPYSEDVNAMATHTLQLMQRALDNYDHPAMQNGLNMQSAFFRANHRFEQRIPQWQMLLEAVIAQGPPTEKLVLR